MGIFKPSCQEDFWPNDRQELLLKAALLKGPGFWEAWEKWKADFKVSDPVDQATFSLLPALYMNLSSQDVKDVLLEKLKGIYKMMWVKNELVFRDNAQRLLRSFNEAGIKIMLLQGMALTQLYDKTPGVRPMEDLDILIPTEKMGQAIDLLNNLGWKTTEPCRPIGALTEFYDHSRKFINSDGYLVGLHWHLFSECCDKHADDIFWERAVKLEVFGAPVFALDPTDQLLYLCVHGTRYSPSPSLRWIADALKIINDPPRDIDWDRLMVQARELQLTLHAQAAFNYFYKVFPAPIPEAVLKEINDLPVPEEQRQEYKINAASFLPVTSLRYILFSIVRLRRAYSRAVKNTGLQRGLIGFMKVLQNDWGIDSLWKVPFQAIFKSLRLFFRLCIFSFKKKI